MNSAPAGKPDDPGCSHLNRYGDNNERGERRERETTQPPPGLLYRRAVGLDWWFVGLVWFVCTPWRPASPPFSFSREFWNQCTEALQYTYSGLQSPSAPFSALRCPIGETHGSGQHLKRPLGNTKVRRGQGRGAACLPGWRCCCCCCCCIRIGRQERPPRQTRCVPILPKTTGSPPNKEEGAWAAPGIERERLTGSQNHLK